MRLRFRGHNYNTQILFGIKTRLSKWFGKYKWPVVVWIGHGDGCCNYWTTIDNPSAQRAIMSDPDLANHIDEDGRVS